MAFPQVLLSAHFGFQKRYETASTPFTNNKACESARSSRKPLWSLPRRWAGRPPSSIHLPQKPKSLSKKTFVKAASRFGRKRRAPEGAGGHLPSRTASSVQLDRPLIGRLAQVGGGRQGKPSVRPGEPDLHRCLPCMRHRPRRFDNAPQSPLWPMRRAMLGHGAWLMVPWGSGHEAGQSWFPMVRQNRWQGRITGSGSWSDRGPFPSLISGEPRTSPAPSQRRSPAFFRRPQGFASRSKKAALPRPPLRFGPADVPGAGQLLSRSPSKGIAPSRNQEIRSC